MAGRLYLITGTDGSRISERALEVARELAGDTDDAFGLDIIREGDEVTPADALAQAIQSILTPPFLSGEKTVWLRDFSGFKEEGSKSGGGGLPPLFERLNELLAAGVPDGLNVLLSGTDVDKRRRLYKLCNREGTVETLDKPDITRKHWQQEMARVLREKAEVKGLRLTREATDHLISVIGTHTGAVETELEKLRCYLGQDGSVSGETAQLLCHGDGETVYWALTDAIGQRDLPGTMNQIEAVLRLEKNPDGAVLGMVLQIATHFRLMLQAKVLTYQVKVPAKQLSRTVQTWSDDRKVELALQGLEIVGKHPYRCQMVAVQAERFSGRELVDAVIACRDVCLHCVTSGADKRVALESMLARTLATE